MNFVQNVEKPHSFEAHAPDKQNFRDLIRRENVNEH